MLGPPGTFDFLMLSTPNRKFKKNPATLIFFVILFAAIQCIEIVNIYPHLNLWQVFADVSLALICASALAIVYCKDPGYLNSEGTDFMEMVEVVDCT